MKNTNKPIETLRCNTVKAAILENETEHDVGYAVLFSIKSMKDNKWKEAFTVEQDNLNALIIAAQMAHHAIMFRELIVDHKLRLVG